MELNSTFPSELVSSAESTGEKARNVSSKVYRQRYGIIRAAFIEDLPERVNAFIEEHLPVSIQFIGHPQKIDGSNGAVIVQAVTYWE